jgi:hypothetical protein
LSDLRYSQKRYRNQSAHGTPPGKEKNTSLSPVSIWSLKWIKMAGDTTFKIAVAAGVAILRGWVRQ